MITTIILLFALLFSISGLGYLCTYLLQGYFYYICELDRTNKNKIQTLFSKAFTDSWNNFKIWIIMSCILWSIFYYLIH
jgi:hypothetical protein